MALWILVCQLLLLPLAWATMPSASAAQEQLRSSELEMPCTHCSGRELELRVELVTESVTSGVRPWAYAPLIPPREQFVRPLSFSGLHLTFSVIHHLHQDHFIPPPAIGQYETTCS